MGDAAMRPLMRHGADDAGLLVAPFGERDAGLTAQPGARPVGADRERRAHDRAVAQGRRAPLPGLVSSEATLIGALSVTLGSPRSRAKSARADRAVLDDVAERRVADLAMVVVQEQRRRRRRRRGCRGSARRRAPAPATGRWRRARASSRGRWPRCGRRRRPRSASPDRPGRPARPRARRRPGPTPGSARPCRRRPPGRRRSRHRRSASWCSERICGQRPSAEHHRAGPPCRAAKRRSWRRLSD